MRRMEKIAVFERRPDVLRESNIEGGANIFYLIDWRAERRVRVTNSGGQNKT